MKKYYYLDENGNKKNYVGKIINDYITGETYGKLIKQEVINKEVELEYHPQVEKQVGWSSYFTYVDSLGNNVRFEDSKSNIKYNSNDNSYFINKSKNVEIKLIKHNKVDYVPGYFTYTNPFGKVIKYEGEHFYDKSTNSYYFYK